MRRLAIGLCIWTAAALTLCSTGKPAYGQEDQQQSADEAAAEPPEGGEAAQAPPPEGEPAQAPPDEGAAALPPDEATRQEVAGAATPTENVKQQGERWRDILVVPLRPVLKAKRVELTPMYHFTLNNPLIRHHAVGAQVNFFLSEALWLGLEGQYYFPQQTNSSTGTYFLTGAQTKVLPAVNRLIFSAMLDFGYVPVYGKFALFNRRILHWEGYVTLGIGTFMTQVIPVKRSDPAFTNISAMFNVGIGARLFLTRWLALNSFLKLYGYPDTFEPVANASFSRDPAGGCRTYLSGKQQGTDAFESAYSDCRKDNGNTTLALDVVFGLGVSIFLPPSFKYKQR